MISKELIEKINSLWHKQNTVGLTDTEKEEQSIVRRQYIDAIKGQIRNMLDTVKNPGDTAVNDVETHNSCSESCSCKHCED